MKKRFFLFMMFCLGFGVVAQAQVELPETINTDMDRSYVFEDPRIDLLIKQQRYINTLALKNISGYRVQVISTRDRAKANDAKAKLMRMFSDYKTYLNYQSPYFRVRIGNFFQRSVAEKLQKKLSPYFPNGVFTVRTGIEIDPSILLRQLETKHAEEN